MTEINKDKLRNFFQSHVDRSGHTLEVIIAENLPGYSVENEVPFIDKDGSIGRYTDLIATRMIPSLDTFGNISVNGKRVVGQVRLVIECKNLPDHGWVFWYRKPPDIVFVDNATLGDHVDPKLFERDPINRYLPYTVIPELFCASGYEEYIYDSGKKSKLQRQKSNQKTTNILDATRKVIKATDFQVQSFRDILSYNMPALASKLDNFFLFTYVQPVIIFQGHLYGVKIHDKKSQIEEVKFVQLPKKYVSQNYNISTGMIHIVSFHFLDEYLGLLESYYMKRASKMLRDQESLMDKVYLMVTFLQKRIGNHLGSCAGRFQKLLEYTEGKPLEMRLSEIKLPEIYLRRNVDQENQGSNRNEYESEINNCMNCGTEVTVIPNPEEMCCCSILTEQVSSRTVKVSIDSTISALHRFYINVLPRKEYLNQESQGDVVDTIKIHIRWCPYCGVKIFDPPKRDN